MVRLLLTLSLDTSIQDAFNQRTVGRPAAALTVLPGGLDLHRRFRYSAACLVEQVELVSHEFRISELTQLKKVTKVTLLIMRQPKTTSVLG